MKKGHGAPDVQTVGNVGDFYEDLDTGKVYKLVAIVLKETKSQFVTTNDYVTHTNQYIWADIAGGGSGGSSDIPAQSDWNAAEGEPGHVLNRTHWVESTNFANVENESMDLHTEDGSAYYSPTFGKTELPETVTSLVGAKVSATINGEQFDGEFKEVTWYNSYFMEDATRVLAGNLHLRDNKSDTLVDTGEHWCIEVSVGEAYPYDHGCCFSLYGTESMEAVTVESLVCFNETVKTIDPKFLPGTTEEWTFTLEDGSTVTKKVMVVSE